MRFSALLWFAIKKNFGLQRYAFIRIKGINQINLAKGIPSLFEIKIRPIQESATASA